MTVMLTETTYGMICPSLLTKKFAPLAWKLLMMRSGPGVPGVFVAVGVYVAVLVAMSVAVFVMVAVGVVVGKGGAQIVVPAMIVLGSEIQFATASCATLAFAKRARFPSVSPGRIV
jgi:hypothetical protein